MAGVNKVILVGNLGSDPEIKTLPSGIKVANFNIATSESYTNKSGEKVTQTEWHKIELWDSLATIAEQYLKKGSQVYVEGKLKTEEWTDNSGNQRTTLRVRGTSMQMLGGRTNSAPQEDSFSSESATPSSKGFSPKPIVNTSSEDDLPF